MRTIIPDYIPRRIEERGDPALRAKARRDRRISAEARARRAIPPVEPEHGERREIRDAEHKATTEGRVVRRENGDASSDVTAETAYMGLGWTYDMLFDVFQRQSIDDRNAMLVGVVHYEDDWNNAAWDGAHMLFGDGDGVYFRGFADDLGVVAHELGHGVTQHTSDLAYIGQSGALNEHFSDVIASLVKQFIHQQTVDRADWLIGESIFTERIQGRALRDMHHPGTAYDDPVLGKDPQPAHMDDFYSGFEDNGGVHINSGIPNRVFCETALALGGFAWDHVGRIWWRAFPRLRSTATFQDAADGTVQAATELFDAGIVQVLTDAWANVGITVGESAPQPSDSPCQLPMDPEFMTLLHRALRLPSVRRALVYLRREARG